MLVVGDGVHLLFVVDVGLIPEVVCACPFTGDGVAEETITLAEEAICETGSAVGRASGGKLSQGAESSKPGSEFEGKMLGSSNEGKSPGFMIIESRSKSCRLRESSSLVLESEHQLQSGQWLWCFC